MISVASRCADVSIDATVQPPGRQALRRVDGTAHAHTVGSMARYDHSPTRLNDPITLDEAERIAENPKLLSKATIPHYAARVLLTIQRFTEDLQMLNRTLQRVQNSQRQLGPASTLDPRSAVRYLTLEQFAEVGDELLRQRVAHIRHIQDQATELRADLQRRLAAFQLRVQLLLDSEIDDATKQALVEALERIDTDVPEVPDLVGPEPARLSDTPERPDPEPSSLEDLFD